MSKIIELEKKKVELMRVSAAKAGMFVSVLEYKEKIKSIENTIEIQVKREKELQKEISEGEQINV